MKTEELLQQHQQEITRISAEMEAKLAALGAETLEGSPDRLTAELRKLADKLQQERAAVQEAERRIQVEAEAAHRAAVIAANAEIDKLESAGWTEMLQIYTELGRVKGLINAVEAQADRANALLSKFGLKDRSSKLDGYTSLVRSVSQAILASQMPLNYGMAFNQPGDVLLNDAMVAAEKAVGAKQ